ncbi:MAG: acetoacetate decarboxylase family protein [Pseudomonadota bacterium]
MGYMIDRRRKHLMPIHFGPACGPRQNSDGGRFIDDAPTKRTRYGIQFLSDADAISDVLPEGVVLDGPPVITIEYNVLKDISWLAGRGYNVLSVRTPVRFEGRKDDVRGPFILVLWEGMSDPVTTGREQMGYPKLFADLPDPTEQSDDTFKCIASWEGFEFFNMTVQPTIQLTGEQVTGVQENIFSNDGIIVHKYFPRTGDGWRDSDVDYFTITPLPTEGNQLSNPPLPQPEIWFGSGSFEFKEASWEDMPTQYHVINGLRALPIVTMQSAFVAKELDRTDFHDQRILE